MGRLVSNKENKLSQSLLKKKNTKLKNTFTCNKKKPPKKFKLKIYLFFDMYTNYKCRLYL